jgi:hypothetical protein
MPAKLRTSALFGFALALLIAGCQSSNSKSYLRSPLVRELRISPGPPGEPENSTQAEPYPPPRPILPDEPSNFAAVPMIQTPDRTPAP